MQRENDRLFAALDPPPGGPERMRKILREGRLSGTPSLHVAIVGLVALAVLCALLVYVPGERSGDEITLAGPEFDRLLGRGNVTRELDVTVDNRTARAEPLASTDPRVRIYNLR